MAYLVDDIVPVTLTINGVLVFSGGNTDEVPKPFTDWYNITTGLVDCSYGLLECNLEQITCI